MIFAELIFPENTISRTSRSIELLTIRIEELNKICIFGKQMLQFTNDSMLKKKEYIKEFNKIIIKDYRRVYLMNISKYINIYWETISLSNKFRIVVNDVNNISVHLVFIFGRRKILKKCFNQIK